MDLARYGQAFKDRAVARLPAPESAALELVAREVGIGAGTLERWREDAQSRPARGRAWTAGARLEAVITTAALSESSKSAWCREHAVYPSELDTWRASCTAALAAPEEARASPQATRQDQRCQIPADAAHVALAVASDVRGGESMLSLCTSRPTCEVIDFSMARLLANSQRPNRPPVRCIGVARHASGGQPTLLQGSSRPNSRSHLV